MELWCSDSNGHLMAAQVHYPHQCAGRYDVISVSVRVLVRLMHLIQGGPLELLIAITLSTPHYWK